MPAASTRLPTGPGEKVLRAIARHHLLTAEQITRLGIVGKTPQYAYLVLRQLTLAGYLQKSDSQLKYVSDVWVLTEKGRHHLLEQGIAVEEKIRHKPPHSLNLAHRIAVNDVLIALELLSRREPRFQMLEIVNETNLLRRAVKVTLSTGKQMRYAPDAWVHYLFDGHEGGLLFEVDRGTEEQKVWCRKVDAMLAYTAGKPSIYEKALGTDLYRFAVLAVPGEGKQEVRARNLHQWTMTELTRLGKERWHTKFWVRPGDPTVSDPDALAELFFGSCWRHPGQTEAIALLGGTE